MKPYPVNHAVYIGAGSNIGNRLTNLQQACDMLNELPQTSVEKVSDIYISEPFGYTDQEWFYNAVFKLRTELTPKSLLSHCQQIEFLMGRPIDHPTWGPRIIDLDILLYNGTTCDLEHLIIPHPELHKRKFVLVPFLDVANPVHPVLGKKIHELLETCGDTSEVERVSPIFSFPHPD